MEDHQVVAAADEVQSGRAGSDCSRRGWRKSSYSNHQSACVEVRIIDHKSIAFRDSKDPNGPVLTFGRGEASSFVAAAAAGELTPGRR
jgi:hypothetical protein